MQTVLLPLIVAIFIGEWLQRSNSVQSDAVPEGRGIGGGQSIEDFFCRLISFGAVAILLLLKVNTFESFYGPFKFFLKKDIKGTVIRDVQILYLVDNRIRSTPKNTKNSLT